MLTVPHRLTRLVADAQVPEDAACRRAAETTKVDFANFQRRIHSLLRADGTLPVQIRNGHHSLLRADGTLPVSISNRSSNQPCGVLRHP
jgi:hypothetical protein